MSQKILVTGASRGIGLALVRELVSQGHSVLGCARDAAGATALKETGAAVVDLDVDSDESVSAAARHLASQPGGLDILVNNAAIFPEEGNETLQDMDLRWFREAFETNVIGTVRVTRAFKPLLVRGINPRVVNISSGAGSISKKDDFAYYSYSASKAALNMVTRAIAAEYRGAGICVVAMSPGWVRTDMGGSNAPLSPEESARAIARTVTNLSMKQTSLFLERGGEQSDWAW